MSEEVLHSLGCDYITATAKDRDAAIELHELGSMLFRSERDFGNKSSPWGMSGYSGYKCGSVQVATLGESVMVRLSSDAAARNYKRVLEVAQNVSRLDLQATVRTDANVTRKIDTHKKNARRDSARHKDKRIVRWIQEHHGGYTLYLGGRKSNVFGRIYDKFEESKLPQDERCLRYEVQFQKRLAWSISRSLRDCSSPMPRIASYVTQFFAGRGVDLELPYKDGLTYCCERRRSDADKNLRWLATAVQPLVSRLIASGRGDEVLKALGLIVEDS